MVVVRKWHENSLDEVSVILSNVKDEVDKMKEPDWLMEMVRSRWRSDGSDGAVAMSSANGLVGTGFASRFRLQCRVGF